MPIENKNRSAAEDASLQVAEESRQSEWTSKSLMREMFLGNFDVSLCYPFPEQDPQDAKIGDEYCAKVEEWCKNDIDGEEIDRTETIPAHVWRGMKELNLLAIKIPTEYGGLGMTQQNYMRILSVVARYCGAVAATLSAHQSIGVPQPIKLAGTKEQKEKWLPKFAEGWVSAFGLTEESAGSDPATMKTTADIQEDGSWLLNGEKLWCTNSIVADVIVVMAVSGKKTSKSGREFNEISAFILEMDTPGVDLLHRCEFMGIKAIENGLIRFTDVKVPAENLIGGRGNGLKLALSTLNDGRLSIPAISADGSKEVLKFSAQWAKTRSQWGRTIGKHEPGADKLSKIASSAYAMSALSDYCAALSGQGKDIRLEAASAKMWNTEELWTVMDTALQLRGGRGYEKGSSLEARGENPFPYERALRDSRINRIVEGTTDVMNLFVARECLDFHLSNAAPLFSSKTPAGEKLKTVLKCAGIYAPWTIGLFFPSFTKSFSQFHPKLRPYLRKIDAFSKKLAFQTFKNMVLLGPKLETKQLFMSRVVGITVDLSTMALSASRVQTAIDANGKEDDLQTVLYFLRATSLKVESTFRELSDSKNCDAAARKLAEQLLDGVDLLPASDTSHLTGYKVEDREYGKDLTSGKIHRRKREIERGFKLPSGMSDEAVEAQEEGAAK